MKKNLFSVITFISVLSAHADEGMWTLYNLDQRTYETMRSMGFMLTQDELFNNDGTSLKDAVVLFGGFCSGVVVSDQGLVFTNHHCGYGVINQLSTTEDDILKNGFVAKNLEDERPVDNLYIAFLENTIDVTSELNDTTKRNDIVKKYEKQYPNHKVTVDWFYGHSKLLVSVYRKYTDIRLAFTPPESLGKFGGDTDNWMWPRQTSDFSVFRIYTAPDGSPADYSPENIPLCPKRWAKVSLDGFQMGDYSMTVGFPGSTERYMSSYGILNRMTTMNAAMINVRGVKQEVWKKWMNSDRAIALKYASKYARSSNYWKNSIGMNRAIELLNVIEHKKQLESVIKGWIDGDVLRKEKYGKVLTTLENNYKKLQEKLRAFYFTYETLSGIDVLENAHSLDILYLADSTDKVWLMNNVKEKFKNFDANLDRDAMKCVMKNYLKEVPRKYQPRKYLKETLFDSYNGNVDKWVDMLFAYSMADNAGAEYIYANADKYDDVIRKDAIVRLRDEFYGCLNGIMYSMSKEKLDIDHNENLLTQAVLEMQADQPHYSDANMTMRLSYGSVKDYTGSDGVHQDAQTWPVSLLDKAEQQEKIEDYKLETNIMQMFRQREWGRYADKKKNDLPLCFLTTNDITGGNSGSPIFNSKGELIGLAFDGNWDAMSGDITFDANLQRCIGVDIRYVMYLMDKWGKADRLVNEVIK